MARRVGPGPLYAAASQLVPLVTPYLLRLERPTG